jgi:hypothetical protein
MRNAVWLSVLLLVGAGAGCASSPSGAREDSGAGGSGTTASDPLLDKPFVLEVVRYVYRWHFDQSYALGAGKLTSLEVWSRRLHPALDPGDRSDFAEMWIPAVNTAIELKRAEYKVPEFKLEIAEHSFKVTEVHRQLTAPAPRRDYQVSTYPLDEIREYLFNTRTNRVLVSESLRAAARKLVADYLNKTYPEPFTVDQVGYLSPLSSVSNELWFFWETGRKVLFFSADVDLTSPSFTELGLLRMQAIDLDKDVVASTKEVPGSNAFVTKDWVGRLLFNCILYGERIVRTPEQLRRLRSDPMAQPGP